METLARGPQQEFRHVAAIHDSDEVLLAQVVPFVEAGLRAGDPIVVSLNPSQQAVLEGAVGRAAGLSVVPTGERYVHPLSTLRANRSLVESHLAAGARRVRLLGDLSGMSPRTWRGWARYEALCSHHLSDLAVSALCVYDARDTSDEVLADVRRVHSHLVGPAGEDRPNPEYLAPEAFLEDWSRTAADALEAGAPDVVSNDPTPADGRRAVTTVAAEASLDPDGLVSAVSELLANASEHGRPPVTLRVWSRPGRVVVTVTDAGPGPADPFVGLLSPDVDSVHGRGLWIAHHMCSLLSISSSDDGCVVRMVADADAS